MLRRSRLFAVRYLFRVEITYSFLHWTETRSVHGGLSEEALPDSKATSLEYSTYTESHSAVWSVEDLCRDLHKIFTSG